MPKEAGFMVPDTLNPQYWDAWTLNSKQVHVNRLDQFFGGFIPRETVNPELDLEGRALKDVGS